MENQPPPKSGRLPRVYERLARARGSKKPDILERPSLGYVAEKQNREDPQPKSHGLLASISQSFSRASTRGRHTGDDCSGHAGTTNSSRLSLARFSKKHNESSLTTTIEQTQEDEAPRVSNSPVLMPRPVPVVRDPRQVAEAMPPEYWTGRFMSLHDQFHSEVFEPANINTIIEAQATRSSFNPANKTEPVVTNNPSTSAYAPTRLPRLSLNQNKTGPRGSMSLNKRVGGLQHSTTSNAILQSSGNRPKPPSRLTYSQPSPDEPAPLIPGPEDMMDGLDPEELEYFRCSSCSEILGVKQPFVDRYINHNKLRYIKDTWVAKKERWETQQKEIRALRQQRKEAEGKWREDQQRQRDEYARLEAQQREEQLRQETKRNNMLAMAAELVDDENRCKRVLVTLEGLCVSNEALRSFHS